MKSQREEEKGVKTLLALLHIWISSKKCCCLISSEVLGLECIILARVHKNGRNVVELISMELIRNERRSRYGDFGIWFVE
ncbi:hypothetical protein Lal_00038640 [Lupinus albus]|nr:hypothetical protein Lal_00038640 [Lupinus albus]